MTPEKIESMIKNANSEQWIYIFIFIFISIIINYGVAYLVEKEKNLATKEDIENITSKIESVKQKFSELTDIRNRFNSKQFELYNDLWVSLFELKVSADILWEEAIVKNLKDFSQKLYNAKISIEKNSLLIEDSHYGELMNIIEKLDEYQNGKKSLIKIRGKSIKNINDNYDIPIIIANNRESKNSYNILLKKLKEEFKKIIRGFEVNKDKNK